MKKYIGLSALFAVTLVMPSFANDSVEMRQERFKALGDDIKQVFRKHLPANDFAAIESFAKGAEGWAKEIPTAFPEGATSKDAKPEIWENWSDFEAKAQAFEAASAKLALAAQSQDAGATGAAAKALGATCKACHNDYRN